MEFAEDNDVVDPRDHKLKLEGRRGLLGSGFFVNSDKGWRDFPEMDLLMIVLL